MRQSGTRKSNCLPLSPRRRVSLLRAALLESLEPRVLLTGNVTTIHADPFSTGNFGTETVLTPANVIPADFGRQFITPMDGQVYAEPLAVGNVNITRISAGSSQSTGIHNVLYVATMHDSLFAVDADTGAILWQDSFLQITDPRVTTTYSPVPTVGVNTFPASETLSGYTPATTQINAGQDTNAASPEIGIFGTPLIDAANGILYCIASTQGWRTDTSTTTAPAANGTVSGTDWHYVFRIWAVNLSDGAPTVSTPALPTRAPMPTSGGAVIGDTVLNPTTYAAGQLPPYSSFFGYQYYAGPYIKASGDNTSTYATHPNNVDGWVTNPNDTASAFAGTIPTATSNSMGQAIAFNAIVQGMRVGMAELNGVLYASFTSHGDKGPYYGWIVGINASTLQTQSVFVTTPTYTNWNVVSGNNAFHDGDTVYDAQGAIWGGEQGIITDGTYLYAVIGNGDFNWTPGNWNAGYVSDTNTNELLPMDGNFGNSYIKIAIDPNANQSSLDINNKPAAFTPGGKNLNGYGLKIADFFTPSDLLYRNYQDWDVGSTGITLIPNSVTSTVPGHIGDNMMFVGSKEGKLYLLDRSNMGGFNTTYFQSLNGSSSKYGDGSAVFDSSFNVKNGPDARLYDRVLGEYLYAGADPATDGIGGQRDSLDTAAFFVNGTTPTMYNIANGTGMIALNVSTIQYTVSGPPASVTNPTPLAGPASLVFSNSNSPVISSNGTSNGIVWAVRANNNTNASSSTDNLVAYNPSLDTPLYDSDTNIATDALTGRGSITIAGAPSMASVKATKFSQPTVFNGMVYVGIGGGFGGGAVAQGAIVGYGLKSTYLSSTSNSFFAAPSSLAGTYITGTGVSLSWTRNSSLETHFKIERSTDNSNWTVAGFADNGTTVFVDPSPQTGQSYYRVSAINGANTTIASNTITINSTIAGRRLFYNNSTFDTTNDNAIATDKSALLPGQTATFANYSSFDRGINGIMIDISGTPGTLTAADFTFRIGNSNSTSSWSTAAAPLSITSHPGIPSLGITRFDILWADNAIKNQWLQITLKGGAGSTSGLAADDVFYFGNAIGESGNSPTSTRVDAIDQLAPRANATTSALITSPYDYNRDGTVSPADETVARTHVTTFLTDLLLLSAPAGASLPVGNPQTGPSAGTGDSLPNTPMAAESTQTTGLATQTFAAPSEISNPKSEIAPSLAPATIVTPRLKTTSMERKTKNVASHIPNYEAPIQRPSFKPHQPLNVPAIKKAPPKAPSLSSSSILQKLRRLFN